MPKISVIVPTFKTAKYLPKCLDSILNQTFQDFEIIIVSDGPKEDHEIADEYAAKDNRITVIKDVNKGLGGARNAALEIAKGEYISFVDSDDWIEPETFEKTLKVFTDDIDLVVFNINILGDKQLIDQGKVDYYKVKFEGKNPVIQDLIFDTNVSAWNKIYRKSIINKYNIRFPEELQYEDFPFYFTYCFVSNSVYYLKDKLYNYFQRQTSGMAITSQDKPFKYIKDHLVGCKFLFDELNKKDLFTKNTHIFSKIYSEWINVGLCLCKKKDKLTYLNLAYKYFEEMNIEIFDFKTLELLKQKRFNDIIQHLQKEYIVSLFGLIPILRVKVFPNKIKVYLFGVVILRIKRG